MTNNYKVYYIPTNPQITKGHIYTFYLNNNTNLDLSSIITNSTPTKPISNPIPTPEIILSPSTYQKLLELNTKLDQLAKERTSEIQTFLQKENNLANAITQITNERQELIKSLKKGQ